MRPFRAAILAALFLFGPATPGAAQDVTLRARDGAIEITGMLLGFDGEFYRVETDYGELTIDGSGVLCEGPGCPSLIDFVAEIDISGSATMGSVLMPALVEGFALRNGLAANRVPEDDQHFTYELANGPKVVGRFRFRLTNTDEGFADLLGGDADVVMALREIREAELIRAREAGLGQLDAPNRSRVLALDALIPVVAANNPLARISVTDLASVLAGRMDNWTALGGPDAPITLHVRNRGSGLLQNSEDRILRPARLTLAENARVHETTAELAATVSEDILGLGVASYSDIGNAKALTLAGTCGFELAGTRRNIKTEDYPLTAPMFLYLPARRLPALAREFLAYTRSSPAQIVIRRAGFVDQAPETIPINLQGDRFANAISVSEGGEGLARLQSMMAVLRPMERLSTSFRFEAGSARLDAQSRSNVQQLAHAIEMGTYDARSLVFLGFSDGQGPDAPNLRIAQRRAEAVRMAVLDAAEAADVSRVDVTSTAFGEALPMACDDSAWGRQVNRRVEVWIQ